MNTSIKTVARYSNLLMLLTSVHHVYGALRYNTPWRLHMLYLSIPLLVCTLLLSASLLKEGRRSRGLLFGCFWALMLLLSIGLVGLFEGLYNHTIKDILFYGGTSRDLLATLFPPPTYEMPNDFWFEFTGVFQSVLLIPLLTNFWRLTTVYVQRRKSLGWKSLTSTGSSTHLT